MSSYTHNKFINDPNHVWSKIISMVGQGSEVLDIGCSSGNLGHALIEKKHCIVDGIELDKHDADLAAKRLRDVWAYNIEDPKTVDKIHKKYDVIIFADVLEHLVDPVTAIKRCKSLLKTHGRIVFSMPNMAHVSIRLALLGGDFDYGETGLLDKTHLHFFNLKNINQIFSQANMTIKQLDSSAFQYSNHLIELKLDTLGFKALDKGLRLLQEPDAATFQYVGFAIYANTPSAKLKPTTQAIQKDIDIMSHQLLGKDEEIAQLKNKLNSLDAAHKIVTEQLNSLINSKSFRVSQKVIAPYRAVISKKRKK